MPATGRRRGARTRGCSGCVFGGARASGPTGLESYGWRVLENAPTTSSGSGLLGAGFERALEGLERGRFPASIFFHFFAGSRVSRPPVAPKPPAELPHFDPVPAEQLAFQARCTRQPRPPSPIASSCSGLNSRPKRHPKPSREGSRLGRSRPSGRSTRPGSLPMRTRRARRPRAVPRDRHATPACARA
jgi:hypothetical protein